MNTKLKIEKKSLVKSANNNLAASIRIKDGMVADFDHRTRQFSGSLDSSFPPEVSIIQ